LSRARFGRSLGGAGLGKEIGRRNIALDDGLEEALTRRPRRARVGCRLLGLLRTLPLGGTFLSALLLACAVLCWRRAGGLLTGGLTLTRRRGVLLSCSRSLALAARIGRRLRTLRERTLLAKPAKQAEHFGRGEARPALLLKSQGQLGIGQITACEQASDQLAKVTGVGAGG
jgi:hypothetical protein